MISLMSLLSVRSIVNLICFFRTYPQCSLLPPPLLVSNFFIFLRHHSAQYCLTCHSYNQPKLTNFIKNKKQESYTDIVTDGFYRSSSPLIHPVKPRRTVFKILKSLKAF
ncbi:hypothetical protein ACH5RR_002963 [Cinchona calisaya]|uniref:Secreted protein n=1 Tax=Cinchona calisaya TaxID=153742 RepID=A0ABD3ATD8_9GENT